MNAITPTGQITVDELIRYAAHRYAAAGIEFRQARISHVIRRAGISAARDHVNTYLLKLIQEKEKNAERDRTYAAGGPSEYGYADPTPARAHEHLTQQGWYQNRPTNGGRNV